MPILRGVFFLDARNYQRKEIQCLGGSNVQHLRLWAVARDTHPSGAHTAPPIDYSPLHNPCTVISPISIEFPW
jgi:hypothetical protein